MANDNNARFLAFIKQIEQTPIGYKGLHCHISNAPKQLRTRDNLTKAIQVLNELNNNTIIGKIFLLNNYDIVYVAYNVLPGTLRGAAGKIHMIFGGTALESKNCYGSTDFYTVLDLAANVARLREFAEAAAGMADAADAAANGRHIDGRLLTVIKSKIQVTDLSAMVLNQPVYAVDASRKIVPVFHELYVSIKVLEEAFCPGVSLTASRWLFNDLTEDLDAAVLRILSRSSELVKKRFSLNLNVSSLASEAFTSFDAALTPEQRANIVIEVHRNDLIANFSQFMKLAPALVAKNYSLCLDALDTELLPHLDLKGLHCRFAKVFWSGATGLAADMLKANLAERVARKEGVTYILARCDNADAVRLARAVGIDLLQGKIIDHMVKHNIPF